MASITVRNLDDGLKRRLRIRAAENGHSMEQEVRDILRAALDEYAEPSSNLGTATHDLFRPFGGVELEIPPRQSMRELHSPVESCIHARHRYQCSIRTDEGTSQSRCPPLGGQSIHR